MGVKTGGVAEGVVDGPGVAWYIGTKVFGYKGPTWRTNVDVPANLDVCTFFVSVENFHCQTYLRLGDPMSSNCLFPDSPVPGEF